MCISEGAEDVNGHLNRKARECVGSEEENKGVYSCDHSPFERPCIPIIFFGYVFKLVLSYFQSMHFDFFKYSPVAFWLILNKTAMSPHTIILCSRSWPLSKRLASSASPAFPGRRQRRHRQGEGQGKVRVDYLGLKVVRKSETHNPTTLIDS